MPISHHKYSDSLISHLHSVLIAEAEAKNPRFFQVTLDNKIVIPKTQRHELFETFPAMITPKTEVAEVKIYRGRSPHNDHYILHLKRSPFGDDQPEENGTLVPGALSGVEVEEKINTKLREQETQFYLGDLEKKNKKLKRRLRKKKKYIDKLEDSLVEMKAKRFSLGGINIGDLSSAALEGMIRRNPNWLRGLPGGEALAGVIEADNRAKGLAAPGEATEQKPNPEGEASFSSASEAVPGLTDEQKSDLEFCAGLKANFSQDEIKALIHIINELHGQKHRITEIIALLHSPQESEDDPGEDREN